MRLAVARQEVLQPRRVAEGGRADQHRPADAALDQADPAQDQRPHDALAKFGFRDQQRAQLLRRNQKRFDIALGMAVDQRDAAGKLADLGQKLSRALVDDRSNMAEAVPLGDGDCARQHHEHAGAYLAGFEQSFAVLVGSKLAEPAHARDFVMGERRECLFVTWKRGGSRAGRWTGRDICTHCRRQKRNRKETGTAQRASWTAMHPRQQLSMLAHGGDLAAARAQFPKAPEPFIDLSTGINPHSYPLPELPADIFRRLPEPAASNRLAGPTARSWSARPPPW